VPIRRAAERDRAAVDVELLQGDPELARAGERLRGECLVDLDEVDVVDRQVGARERPPARLDRPDAHDRRVDADDAVRHDPRQRIDPERLNGRLRADDDARGPVVDPRRVAGRDGAALAKGGAQRGEPLDRGVGTRALVLGDDHRLGAAPRDLERDDLALEHAGLARGDRALVGGERELVLVMARDAEALGDVLGGLAHALGRIALGQPRVDEAPADRRVDQLDRAARKRALGFQRDQRRARHRLDSAGEDQIGVAAADRAAGLVYRLEPGGAQAVDGHARGGLGQAGDQRRHPRDVAVLLTGAVRVAEDDVVDRVGVELVAVDRGAHHVRGEVVRAHGRERAGVAADRGAQGVDDEGFGHRDRATMLAAPTARQ
jgi:hypothetical protein